MGKIQLEGMEFYAYHGCFKEEQIVGSKFLVELDIEADIDRPAKTDRLEDTLNYQVIYDKVKNEMSKKSSLLENIAKRILDALFSNFPVIEKAAIKVSKLNPPLGGQIEKVSVTLNRNRSEK